MRAILAKYSYKREHSKSELNHYPGSTAILLRHRQAQPAGASAQIHRFHARKAAVTIYEPSGTAAGTSAET